MTVAMAAHHAGASDVRRALRAAAWTSAFLHAVGLALAVTTMNPGTPAFPVPQRMAYVAARPGGWVAGWLVWVTCALALVAFMALLARAHPLAATRAALVLALGGAAIDIGCDLVYAWVLPARAAGDVAGFLAFERALSAASLTGANGLYSLSVLVSSLALPAETTARRLGLLTFAGGAVLAAAGLIGDPRLVIAGTAVTIPAFVAWSLSVSSLPPRT